MNKLLRMVSALALAGCVLPTHADFQVFTDRAAWRAAAGGAGDLYEDFNGVSGQDLPYGQNSVFMPVTVGFVTFTVVDGIADGSWRIDVPPAAFLSIPSVNESTFATVLGFPPNGGFGDARINFEPARSFGFDYRTGSYALSPGLLTTSRGDSAEIPFSVPGETAFLGVVYTGTEEMTSVVISSVTNRFGAGMDNIEAHTQPCLSVDSDADGVLDNADNCRLVANPDQRDTNADGYGNACDADLDGDGVVNAADLGLLKGSFFQSGDLDADFNGDQVVNFTDLGTMKTLFFASPGPSCVAAAGD